MPTEVPLPAAVAPTVAMCGTASHAVYIEDLGDLHSSINRQPEAQDANWLYKTFKRADGEIIGQETLYGVVSLVNGLPVMNTVKDAGSAVGFAMPLKIRKTKPDKACDSHYTANSTLAATPGPQ